MTPPVFTRTDPALGEFSLRPVDPTADAPVPHTWVTHPKAAFWLMQECDLAAVLELSQAAGAAIAEPVAA